jgi:S1-C subfamily serine protease
MCLRSLKKYVLLGIVITLFVGYAPQTTHSASVRFIAASEPPIEISSPIEQATVNLYCTLTIKKKKFAASGTGVIIDSRGVILTNAHVAQFFLLPNEKGEKVRSECTVRTGSPAKAAYTASIIHIPPLWVEKNVAELSKKHPKGTGEDDFALLLITGSASSTLPQIFPTLPLETMNAGSEKDVVTITGYPTEKLDFYGINKKLTVLTASSSITNVRSFSNGTSSTDVVTLEDSKAGSSGVSGGPVVNQAGSMSALVTSKSTAKNDRALRAITLPYINRRISEDTGYPLRDFISGDHTSLIYTRDSKQVSDMIYSITQSLLKKR